MTCCSLVCSGYTIVAKIVGVSKVSGRAVSNFRAQEERVEILKMNLALLQETFQRLQRCVAGGADSLEQTLQYLNSLLDEASTILEEIDTPKQTFWDPAWRLLSKLRGNKVKQVDRMTKRVHRELTLIWMFLSATQKIEVRDP
jgi:hypothetical protein